MSERFQERVNIDTVLIFIGSPRTGSTLLGQILNYHPQCLISHEASLITKVIVHNANFQNSITEMEKNARKSFEIGVENTDRVNVEIYQPRWISFAELSEDPIFRKKKIKVIGDKKAGGTAKTISKHKNEFIKLMKNKPSLKLLQIVRNPIFSSISYMKSHEIENFEKACEEIVTLTEVGNFMSKIFPERYYCVYYEDLLDNPEETIEGILGYLFLDINSNWVKKISTRINKESKTIEKKEYSKYIDITKGIISRYNAETAFSRYELLKTD
jgi:hypothetical protein